MDALLDFVKSNLERQATGLAFRSTMIYACTFTYNQCKRYRKAIHDQTLAKELREHQQTLNRKIEIVSHAIDLIESRSGRGNTFLSSALPVTRELKADIVSLGKRLEAAAAAEEEEQQAASSTATSTTSTTAWAIRNATRQHEELKAIVSDIKKLSRCIDDAIPLLNLAITGSGESYMAQTNAAGAPTISLSRLMQASTFLREGDVQFMNDAGRRPVQIGPAFVVSCYMLFLGHSEVRGRGGGLWVPKTPGGVNGHSAGKEQRYGLGEGERKPIWQEVMHKARVRICRTPVGWGFDREKGYCCCSDRSTADLDLDGSRTTHSALGRSDGFAYHLEVIEDLEDGRVHDDNDTPAAAPYDGIVMAGIRESIPVHQISKIFYTDTGTILNIGNPEDGENNPVLLLKRQAKAPTPGDRRREQERGPSDDDGEDSKGPVATLEHGINGFSNDNGDDSDTDDEQAAMDRQLRLESEAAESPHKVNDKKRDDDDQKWQFPKHVDQEWIALEVFAEDEDTDNDDGDTEDEAKSVDGSPEQLDVMKQRHKRGQSSVDTHLLAQIRNISLRSERDLSSPSPLRNGHHLTSPADGIDVKEMTTAVTRSPDPPVARPSFPVIKSSLSLMDTLIRLTSAQEFQQTSHLAIPDHILTFFLEETATTGAQGEEKWKVRKEAERRVGFDPYTDTPKTH